MKSCSTLVYVIDAQEEDYEDEAACEGSRRAKGEGRGKGERVGWPPPWGKGECMG